MYLVKQGFWDLKRPRVRAFKSHGWMDGEINRLEKIQREIECMERQKD